MILYLHGFRSSPTSFKAQLMGSYLATLGRGEEFVCPQLPASPAEAIVLATSLVESCPPEKLCIVGSSLGGFYATYLAEQLGCKAVLINPAVKSMRDLEKYVGVTTSYHSNERFEFTKEHLQQLSAFSIDTISSPNRYLLLAATGDEVLDWREMAAHYPLAHHCVVQGGDHAFSAFSDYMAQVMVFCDGD